MSTKPKLKLWPHPIVGAKPVPAFAVGDTTYYHFPNDLKLGAIRAHAGMDVYKELSFNVHKEDLMAYFQAQKVASQKIREAFTVKNGVFNIEAAVRAADDFDKLTQEIEARAGWVTSIGLIFKLASVLYFDETEDPYGYDDVYAVEKINRWAKALEGGELPAFFLKRRMSELLGLPDTSLIDTPTYTTLLNELRKTSNSGRLNLLQSLSNTIGSIPGNENALNSLRSSMATLQQPTTSNAKV